MTYEAYRLLFLISGALSAAMFALSVILFFALRIPYIIGDLSGANARKAIAKIRAQNEQSGKKTYKSSAVNKARGRVTDEITPSGKLERRGQTGGAAMHTEKIESETALLEEEMYPRQETAVLSEETTVEPDHEIFGYGTETSILGVSESGNYGLTSVLDGGDHPYFEIEFELTYIHSNVQIP